MALSVSIYPTVNRCDSTDLPLITATDNGSDSFLKIGAGIESWLYIPIASTPFNTLRVIMPNRTAKIVYVKLRDTFFPTGDWTLTSGVVEEADNGIHRTSGEGYGGAIYPTALSATKCSIQGKTTSTSLTTGISLQDGSGTISHNYTDITVAHSIIFGQDGQGSIRELGVLVSNNGTFRYEVGDMGMIEVDNGVVYYYLIKPDGTMRLLRKTRSKLTEAPKAEVLTYFTGSYLSAVLLFDDAEAETSFENVGVAWFNDGNNELYWQMWTNQRATQSIGEALEMADKRTQTTYANQKKRLAAYSLTPKAQSRTDYWKFQDFVNWHDSAKEFIFVDYARKDLDDNPSEYWMKFTSPFVDATRNGCQFEQQVSILEDFRADYIPRIEDTTPPEVEITSIADGSAILSGTASDNVLLVSLLLYMNGRKYADIPLPDTSGNWTYTVPTEDLAAGVNTFWVVAVDYAGNQTVSASVDYGSASPSGAFTLGGEMFTLGGEPFTLGV